MAGVVRPVVIGSATVRRLAGIGDAGEVAGLFAGVVGHGLALEWRRRPGNGRCAVRWGDTGGGRDNAAAHRLAGMGAAGDMAGLFAGAVSHGLAV